MLALLLMNDRAIAVFVIVAAVYCYLVLLVFRFSFVYSINLLSALLIAVKILPDWRRSLFVALIFINWLFILFCFALFLFLFFCCFATIFRRLKLSHVVELLRVLCFNCIFPILFLVHLMCAFVLVRMDRCRNIQKRNKKYAQRQRIRLLFC